jgi:hypothetical protein
VEQGQKECDAVGGGRVHWGGGVGLVIGESRLVNPRTSKMPALASGDRADMGQKVLRPDEARPKMEAEIGGRRRGSASTWRAGCFAGEHADLELDCGGE